MSDKTSRQKNHENENAIEKELHKKVMHDIQENAIIDDAKKMVDEEFRVEK
ncbi:hypothetical protein [Scopulibacillus cellulosilyticus]|uniref:Uncharacterized protein n=1 Tax=Scopulibacillus cellulosilyticus TaxID=2665665 RepID=A0ABW2Q1K6_9BACL